MADITVTVEKIGLEDINVGTGTFSRTTSTGGSQSVNKLNAANIPLLTSNTLWPASQHIEDILDMLFMSYKFTLQRAKFTYVDADTITIGPGAYFHAGTKEQVVYWNSTLTFNSTDSGSQWYYLYIDDSAIVSAGTNLLTAAEFCISTTAPTWSDAKHGWYNGADRCIFAYMVVSGSITGFTHDGGDYVRFDGGFTESEVSGDKSGETTVTLTIPSFSTKAMVGIFGLSGANGNTVYISPNTGNDGGYELAGGTSHIGGTAIVFTNASNQVFVGLADYTGTQTLVMQTRGFFFPTGM